MPEEPIIGLLNPGDMGAAAGQCLTDLGYTVLWASDGRGEDSKARAAAAGLTDAGTPRRLADQARFILSVCPPHAALDVAWSVHGFTGLYLDANAIAPSTAREVAQLITGNGGSYADGSIIGPPPRAAGTTRLYLSGEHAPAAAALFSGSRLEPRVTPGPAMAASAVKMAYAAYTKGILGLLLAASALARAEGVEEAMLAEWATSQPQLAAQLRYAASTSAAKGWRWVGEMEEIAQCMAEAGLPDGFHQAAAEIFRRSPRNLAGAPGDELTARLLSTLTGQTEPAAS